MPINARAVRLLPQPLSPTSPNTSDSSILNELGYRRKISEYEKDFYDRKITTIDFDNRNICEAQQVFRLARQTLRIGGRVLRQPDFVACFCCALGSELLHCIPGWQVFDQAERVDGGWRRVK